MAKKEEVTTSGKLESKFNSFLVAKKKLLIIVAVAIVVIVAGLWIGLTVADNRADALQLSIDNLQDTYEQWSYLEDKSTADAQSTKDSLVAELTDFSQKGGKSYPVLKSEYLLGLIAYEDGSYEEALDHFESVHDRSGDTYLASLSLYNAGVASEQAGDTDTALAYYQAVYDTFGNEAAESAKALFSVARLHEANGNVDLARAVFQQLADEFSASEYAKLAQSRLVILQ